MSLLVINWASAFDVVIFGITMVFVILVLLVFVITAFGKMLAPTIQIPLLRPKAAEQPVLNPKVEQEEYVQGHLSAEQSAAIAMALHLYYADVHDQESEVVTIKTVERRYSPWSSKIYGLNNLSR